MRIVDGHAHVASMKFIPREFVAGVARTMVVQGAPHVPDAQRTRQVQMLLEAQHQDHLGDELIEEMDDAGIASTVLLVPDFSHALECSLPIAAMARLHHEIRLRHPGRFLVYQGIDPRGGSGAVEFFEKTVTEYGFDGLKLYPPCGYSPSDERLFAFYEVCRQHGLPVLLHTGPTSPVLDFNYAHPSLIDVAARTFHDVNFILAHGGVTFTQEAAQLCAYRPNVYLDLAGFPSTLHARGWIGHLHDLFRLGINHKIIFGTDWPLFRMTSTTGEFLARFTGAEGPLAGLPPRDIELIMAGNLDRITAVRVVRAVSHSRVG